MDPARRAAIESRAVEGVKERAEEGHRKAGRIPPGVLWGEASHLVGRSALVWLLGDLSRARPGGATRRVAEPGRARGCSSRSANAS